MLASSTVSSTGCLPASSSKRCAKRTLRLVPLTLLATTRARCQEPLNPSSVPLISAYASTGNALLSPLLGMFTIAALLRHATLLATQALRRMLAVRFARARYAREIRVRVATQTPQVSYATMSGSTFARLVLWTLGGGLGAVAGLSSAEVYHRDAEVHEVTAHASILARERQRHEARYAASEARLAALRSSRPAVAAALTRANAGVREAENKLAAAAARYEKAALALRAHDGELAATEATAAAHVGLLASHGEAMERLEQEVVRAKELQRATREAFPLPLRWKD